MSLIDAAETRASTARRNAQAMVAIMRWTTNQRAWLHAARLHSMFQMAEDAHRDLAAWLRANLTA